MRDTEGQGGRDLTNDRSERGHSKEQSVCVQVQSGRDRNLAWGNLRRREGTGKGGACLDPVVRYATSILQGAMVTGWYGNGFNIWPEENRHRLSGMIYKIWKDIAREQHRQAKSDEEKMKLKPSESEARKVSPTSPRGPTYSPVIDV